MNTTDFDAQFLDVMKLFQPKQTLGTFSVKRKVSPLTCVLSGVFNNKKSKCTFLLMHLRVGKRNLHNEWSVFSQQHILKRFIENRC